MQVWNRNKFWKFRVLAKKKMDTPIVIECFDGANRGLDESVVDVDRYCASLAKIRVLSMWNEDPDEQ